MAAPPDLHGQALAIAAAPRGVVTQPFARRNNGRWAFFDDQHREATLHAVSDVYSDLTALHNDPMPAEVSRPEEYYDRPGRVAVNHLRRWVDLWAATYSQEPSRVFYRGGVRLDKADPLVVTLNRLYRDAEVNSVLERLDKDLYLYGTAVLRPWWDDDNAELVVHEYQAFNVRVVQNRLNPSRPWATILLGSEREPGRDGAYQRVAVSEIYTPDEWMYVRGSTVVDRAPLPGDPLVHCFNQTPTLTEGYWCHAPGVALAALTVRLSEDGYSQFFHALLMQAVAQAVMHGNVQGQLELGPGRAVHFPQADDGSRLEYVAPNADLAGFQQGIEWLVQVIRETHGIPQSMLDVHTDASGAAIVQANGPVAELRQRRMKVFRRIETDLLRSIIAVSRGRVEGISGTVDPAEFDVAVRFEAPQASASVQDTIAQETHDLTYGLVTPAELLMRRKPDEFDTIEDAEAVIQSRVKGLETDQEDDVT